MASNDVYISFIMAQLGEKLVWLSQAQESIVPGMVSLCLWSGLHVYSIEVYSCMHWGVLARKSPQEQGIHVNHLLVGLRHASNPLSGKAFDPFLA